MPEPPSEADCAQLAGDSGSGQHHQEQLLTSAVLKRRASPLLRRWTALVAEHWRSDGSEADWQTRHLKTLRREQPTENVCRFAK
jgi:hypothetical protein